ncbi:MAG: hypothetical protein QM831_16525 [Kofleriaceae bacterium]
MADPIFDILEQLGVELPSVAALEKAWARSTAPHAMVRLLAAAGSDECDVAASAAIEAAADLLRSDGGKRTAIDELAAAANRPTVCGELAKLLYVTWVPALTHHDRRDAYEAAIATRIRDAVKRPPTTSQLEPPARRATVPAATRPIHMNTIVDEAQPLESTIPPGSRVISPESFGRLGPELGGLACERIFGPWWPRGNVTEDDRMDRWGYIELAQPCAHPLIANAKLSILPVAPPHVRRATAVPVEELRRHAIAERARLEAADQRGELGDPPDKILAEAGLDDPDAITEPGLREHAMNTVYRAFINIDNRRRRLVELGAPDVVLAQTDAELDQWSKRLLTAWQAWTGELPADTSRAFVLRALAAI